MSSDKEISEEIDLRIIDPEALEREARKIRKAENLANKARVLNRQLTNSRSPINIISSGGRTLPRDFSSRVPRGEYLFGGGLATGVSPLTKFQQEQRQRNPRIEKESRHNPFAQVKNITREGFSLVQNPIGWIAGKLPQILKIAGPVAVAAFALQVAQEVFKIYRDAYGRGGILDVRKLVPDAVREISQLDTIIRINSGYVLFTSDAGQKLRQTAPEFSNTRTLREGHRRFQQIHLGE